MEIHPSITSQALYGENGRAVLPIDVFVKERSKCVNKEHLGVPIVIALIQIDRPVRTYNALDNYELYEPSDDNDNEIAPMETISEDIYNTLLHNVLSEPIDDVEEEEVKDKDVKEIKSSRRRTHKKKH